MHARDARVHVSRLAYTEERILPARTHTRERLQMHTRVCVRARARGSLADRLAGRAGLGYRSEEDLADKAEDFPANY